MAKARVLRKPVPYGGAVMGESSLATSDGFPGWEIITHSVTGAQVSCWYGYLDLAGYAREDQTWFTRDVQLQGVPFSVANITPANLNPILIHDIVSVIPLTDDQLSSLALLFWFPGGIADNPAVTSDIDLQDIIWGRITRLTQNAAAGVAGLLSISSQEFYGVNNGTAADKIHLYRVFCNPNVLELGQGFSTGGSAFVLSGAVDKEPDLEYIMRLKRSYELAGPYS